MGIAKTKTLAKLANRGAKDHAHLDGVCNLDGYSPDRLDTILARTPVGKLWGVGPRYEKKLQGKAIHSARDLRDADPRLIRKRHSVVLQRTVYELRGQSCIPFEPDREAKDQIMFSRSFSHPVTTVEGMEQVLAMYAQRASVRLRRQGSVAGVMQAWAATSGFAEAPYEAPSSVVRFSPPTDDPISLVGAARQTLNIRAGANYVRAGILLTDITPRGSHGLLEPFDASFDQRGVGRALDQVSAKFGTGTVGLGVAGIKMPPGWSMKRDMLSLRATTHWDELATVHVR